jgi:hypothetical protein
MIAAATTRVSRRTIHDSLLPLRRARVTAPARASTLHGARQPTA